MVKNHVLNEVINRIKEIIDTGEFDNTKILVDTDDILPDDIALKSVVIWVTCVEKGDGKIYPKLSLEKVLSLK